MTRRDPLLRGLEALGRHARAVTIKVDEPSVGETDLPAPLRAGATDDDLEEIARAAVWAPRKERKHRVSEPGFVQPERTISAIGG